MGCICQRFSRVQTTPSLAHDLTTMYPLGCFPEGPWWRSLLSAGLCSCDEELSWSWLEREALSLEEFSIRNVYISCFCELMQKQGWLGQCLSDGIKRKVRSMGRFGGPFTSIYEIHEMVTLARIFAWGKWDRTKKLRKLYLLICYICVTAHAPCLQPRCGTKPLRAALQPVKRTWDTSITLPPAWHSASDIPRAACAHGVEGTGSTTHFWEGLIQNPSKTYNAFPVPPLPLSPP